MAYRLPDFEYKARSRLVDLLEELGTCTATEAARMVFNSTSIPASLAESLLEALTRSDQRFARTPDGQWFLARKPVRSALRGATFVVLDVETTGTQPPAHRITELGAVRVRESQIVNEFCSLINPEREIPLEITRLTGISNSMVADKLTALQLLPEFAEWLGDDVIVAHNAPFDRGFIDAQWREVFGMATGNRWLCTVRIARWLYPEIHSRSLGPLCRHLGIPVGRQHRVGDDARATAMVLLREIDDLSARGINDFDALDAVVAPLNAHPAKKRCRRRTVPVEQT